MGRPSPHPAKAAMLLATKIWVAVLVLTFFFCVTALEPTRPAFIVAGTVFVGKTGMVFFYCLCETTVYGAVMVVLYIWSIQDR